MVYVPNLRFLVLLALSPAVLVTAAPGGPGIGTGADKTPSCRNLPGDAGWPTHEEWNNLNRTIRGRLRRGIPLGQSCYTPSVDFDRSQCSVARAGWVDAEIYYQDPVNVMSPFWLNDSCSPFLEPGASCTLGNLAAFAIDVDSADTVAAGLRFAREKNIRLSIKNTGHDYIGRSNGQGSLGLWTHNLKNISFLNYSSPSYTGPAMKAGAGVQFFEAYKVAADHGYRVLGGYCPTVGMVGGYVQSGGHGPLSASYGMAADNTLEFEVVTVDGRHLVASPTQNADLYWALSGGGAGNYAVVLSLTTKAHPDGPTAGAALSFANTNPDTYWAAVGAYHKRMIELNAIPGLATSWGFDNSGFSLDVATLTKGTQADLAAALNPFLQDLAKLNITVNGYKTTLNKTFYDHYEAYSFPPEVYQPNSSLGGRLITPEAVQTNLTGLLDVFKIIVTDPVYTRVRVSGISLNVTHSRVGNKPGSNAVLPAWRDALYTMNLGIGLDPTASTSELQTVQAKVNEWQALFNPLTPGGGGYMNEATWDNPTWKLDYFGSNYNQLLQVKKKYDPKFALWQHTSVGTDEYWKLTSDGHLCRVNK